MLNVCCVNAGNYQGRGADYVNRLYSMVARNLDMGTEGRFVCFTDDPSGLNAAIQTEELPAGVSGWWNKIYLFSPGLFRAGDRVLYFDLDTVIVGELDALAAYDGPFAILRDFYRPDGLQSSVMAWPAGWGAEIWDQWHRMGCPEWPRGDQQWIEMFIYGRSGWDGAVILQDRYPGLFVSYKKDCQPFPPEGAAVCVFHGEPRPHNCGRAWIEAMWTESPVGTFKIPMKDNHPLDQIRTQIAHSANRPLPRLKTQPAHDRKVAIVGGGPSINDPLPMASLARLKAGGAEIWALNGAYEWLLRHEVTPDAQVLLDARPENIAFIRSSRPETTYYIASQCHPSIYEALIEQSRKIIRLDLEVMGDCGTTVGTHAPLVAHVEGFREIHLFGYDSSYREDEGHGYPQPINAPDRVVDATVGGRTFKAAPWMARQVQDFEGIAASLVAAGTALFFHGDGLLPYAAHLWATAPPRAAEVRAQEVLKRLPDKEPLYGAEIGVFAGEMSAALLRDPRIARLWMVDSWEGAGAAYAVAGDDFHAALSQAEQDEFGRRARDAVAFAGDRAMIFRERSTRLAQYAPPTFDFVFIDADHSYEGCTLDIIAWAGKVKAGGLLCGHDYDHPDYDFGVKRAVDEFAAKHNLAAELGENLTWFIKL